MPAAAVIQMLVMRVLAPLVRRKSSYSLPLKRHERMVSRPDSETYAPTPGVLYWRHKLHMDSAKEAAMVALHAGDLFILLPSIILFVLPWIVGFAWVLPDAQRHGQPGMIWALLTLPLGWMAILAYVVVRALTARPVA